MGKKEVAKLLNRMSQDPVHEHEGIWYFWNETWDKRIGSYTNRVAAEEGLRIYIQELNEERDEKENKKIKDELNTLAEDCKTIDEWDESDK